MPNTDETNGLPTTRVDLGTGRVRPSLAESAIDPIFLELRALRGLVKQQNADIEALRSSCASLEALVRIILANQRTQAKLDVYLAACVVSEVRGPQSGPAAFPGWGEPDVVNHGDGRLVVTPNDGRSSAPL